MLNTIVKGEQVLLKLGDSACQRIHSGLSWDATGNTANTDLDLICLLYDSNGEFVEGITGNEDERRDQSGNIHHSGDDQTGEGDFDDERISIELFNLPRSIHHIFLIVEIQTKHTFSAVQNPVVRLADSMTDKNMLHVPLGKEDGGGGGNSTAFIVGRIFRHANGWMLHYIADYTNVDSVKDWAAELKRYLPAPNPEKTSKEDKPLTPAKGQNVPLYYTKQARHRIICGLSWDPNEEQATLGEKLKNRGHNVETFDLDLSCVMYDKNGEPVDGVSGRPEETVDESGHIYHTGDDTTGAGDNDDEQISVELKNIPDDIDQIVFLAEVQSNHTFGQVTNPTIRIANGLNDRNQLLIPLNHEDGFNATACVFARILRDGDGWNLHHIADYMNGADIEDWVEELQKYLE